MDTLPALTHVIELQKNVEGVVMFFKQLINKTPLVFLKPFYRSVNQYYLDHLKGLDVTTWSNRHVARLFYKKYKPKIHIPKIAFVLQSHVDLEQFKNIFPYLNNDDFDIIIVNLESYNSDFKIIQERMPMYRCLLINDVFKKRIRYKLAVLFHTGITLGFYQNGEFIAGIKYLAEKRLHLSTSISNGWVYDKTENSLFNYIICTGECIKRRYEELNLGLKIFVLGSPRFIGHINGTKDIDKSNIYKRYNFDILKKTVVWATVHRPEINSTVDFLSMVSKIQDRFNIILRPHPGLFITSAFKQDFDDLVLRVTESIPDIKIIVDGSNIELFAIADYVFCDYGGSVFTAIRADKKILLFNSHRSDFLAESWRLDSPDIEIRGKIINFNRDQEKEFLTALYDEEIWEKQKAIRQEINEGYYIDNPNAAQDIANLLRQIVNDEI
jgi:hypothetical protein